MQNVFSCPNYNPSVLRHCSDTSSAPLEKAAIAAFSRGAEDCAIHGSLHSYEQNAHELTYLEVCGRSAYTGATSNVPVISVLTRPFFPSPNRDIIRSNKALFGGREKGAVKTEMTGTFEVAPV